MVKLGPTTIDYVTRIDEIIQKTAVEQSMAGIIGSIAQDMIAHVRRHTIEGFLNDPTQQTVEELKSLAGSQKFMIFDATDTYDGVLFFGKPREFRWLLDEHEGTIRNYSFTFFELAAWGTLYINNGNARMADLLYTHLQKWLNPLWGRNNIDIDRTGEDVTFETYLLNTIDAAAAWSRFEMFVPDVLASAKCKVYSWDGAAYHSTPFLNFQTPTYNSDYLEFLDGVTATTKYGSGNGAACYDQGALGDTKAVLAGDSAAGSIVYSMMIGTKYRLGFAVKMPAKTDSDDLTGSNAANKVKIKVEISYSKDKTTYEDGGINYGVVEA